MTRRRFLVSWGCALIIAPRRLQAQPAKILRLGVLFHVWPRSSPVARLLREGLQGVGLVDGQNLRIEFRSADGNPDRYPELVAELTRVHVDVIVAVGSAAAVAAKRLVSSLPIVVTHIGDPVALNLVSSVARPGGNVTGVSFNGRVALVKSLELLREAAPNVRRVVWIHDPTDAPPPSGLAAFVGAATALGLAPLPPVFVRDAADLDRVFGAIRQAGADAICVGPMPSALVTRRIGEFALRHRLPTFALQRFQVADGLLLAYSADSAEQFRRVGYFVDRIVKGTKPGDLPIEDPAQYELAINMKTAKALGLTIAPSILLRANEVIDP